MNVITSMSLCKNIFLTNKQSKISFTSNNLPFAYLESEEQLDLLAQSYYSKHNIGLFNSQRTPSTTSNKTLINFINSNLVLDADALKVREITPNFIVGPNLTYSAFFKENFSPKEALNEIKQNGIDTIVYFHEKLFQGAIYEEFAKEQGLKFFDIPNFELEIALAKHIKLRGTELEKEFIDYFKNLSNLINKHKIYAGCDLGVARTTVMLYYLSAFNEEINDIQLKTIFNSIITPEIEDNFNLLKESI